MTNYQKKGFLTEDFRLFHLRSEGGTRTEFHYHEFCKILLLVSGRGSCKTACTTFFFERRSSLVRC